MNDGLSLEDEWSRELGEEVEIRHVAVWDEYDIYLSNSFAVTVTNLDRADQWLSRYAMVKDEAVI